MVLGAVLAACLTLACAADPRLAAARKSVQASLPAAAAVEVLARIDKAPKRFLELLASVDAETKALPDLLRRADKEKALPESYVPADLVSLDGTGVSVTREGFRLRKPAALALAAMANAARGEGVGLTVGSAYRSYAYQVGVWDRGVQAEGEARTAQAIARPGHSQHQLGTAMDFSPIDDSFARTKASQWLAANAARFGFSLSYPKGMEAVSGYQWESWHWRFVGKPAAALEREYFGGAQEAMVLFMEVRAK